MTRGVRVLRRAEHDLIEISRYHERDAPAAAIEIIDELLDGIESLREFPMRGAIPRDGRLRGLGYRFLVVRQYLIFYQVLRSHVRVYRVLHARRCYEDLL